jgi:molybdopterin/thiamine biosynthesis adenylyltransferase
MNDEQLLRYSRQIMLPDIEIEGQEKLLAAKAIIIGAGGLGCPVALYLAAAGVGSLILIDDDDVDLSNLQRQIAHGVDDIGLNKTTSLTNSIKQINPTIDVKTRPERVSRDELEALIKMENIGAVKQQTIVIDCTDNFETRFMINQACVNTQTPLVSGAAIKLEGQVMVFDPTLEGCACYQCLYQNANDQQLSCAENGVAAPIVGIIGSIQAMEAIKVITGSGETLAGYLLIMDAKSMDWRKLKLPRNPNCSACQKR